MKQPVVDMLQRQTQEGREFKASLSYTFVGSELKSTGHACRGPRFSFQYLPNNSSSRGSDAHFWPPQIPSTHKVHIHTCRLILTHKVKMNKSEVKLFFFLLARVFQETK